MIEEDLKAAKIEPEDSSGRVVDFHVLRHTFITNLCDGGVHPKTAQSLTRYSSITLTMDHYTHLTLASQTNALDALPDLSQPSTAQEARATGTDAAASVPQNVPQEAVKSGDFGKELEGNRPPLRDCVELEKPLPVLETPRTSGMMRSRREGGGIGRRAGLRNRRTTCKWGREYRGFCEFGNRLGVLLGVPG